MLEAHLVAAALHPQQVTARGIGLIVRAADGALAIVALALLGSALGQRCQRRELGKAERRDGGCHVSGEAGEKNSSHRPKS